jgi:16S rRNA processing protein RimM
MDKDVVPKGLVVVGRVRAPQGLKGEIRVEVMSDSPGRFSAGGILYLMGEPYRIEGSSMLPRGDVVLKLEGIEDRAGAERFRGAVLTVPEDMVPPLPEGTYYHFQIIDMRVYTQEDEYLGMVTEILPTGTNDVYVVSGNGREILIPALDHVIKGMDVEGGRMTVELPQGLVPE